MLGKRRRRGYREEPATALARYALLEATGDYHDGLTSRRQEVLVKFGRASLTLSRFDETPVTHWALASLRAVDAGPVDDDALRLTPDPESDERLTLRDPVMIEAIEHVCPDLRAGPPLGRGLLRLGLWSGGAAAALALILFVLVPTLADRLAELVPYEQERRLGEAVAEQVAGLLSDGEACEDPAGRRALRRLSSRLLRHADLPMPVRVRVYESDMENAFAGPGGQILILSGLLRNAAGPDEVAAVLAHELGHVAARDPLRGVLRNAGSAGILGLLVGDFLGGAVVVAMGEAVLNASYTREAEIAADEYAHRLLAEAGLPSAPMAAFFERLAETVGEPEGLMRHLASHPDFAARRDAALAADVVGEAAYEPSLTDAEWLALQQICE
jgi:Zn-dependent protease with chaperone function